MTAAQYKWVDKTEMRAEKTLPVKRNLLFKSYEGRCFAKFPWAHKVIYLCFDTLQTDLAHSSSRQEIILYFC